MGNLLCYHSFDQFNDLESHAKRVDDVTGDAILESLLQSPSYLLSRQGKTH